MDLPTQGPVPGPGSLPAGRGVWCAVNATPLPERLLRAVGSSSGFGSQRRRPGGGLEAVFTPHNHAGFCRYPRRTHHTPWDNRSALTGANPQPVHHHRPWGTSATRPPPAARWPRPPITRLTATRAMTRAARLYVLATHGLVVLLSSLTWLTFTPFLLAF